MLARTLILILSSLLLSSCGLMNSGNDFKTNTWEQLWVDGVEALAQARLSDAQNFLRQAERTMAGDPLRRGITLNRLGDTLLGMNLKEEAEKNYRDAVGALDGDGGVLATKEEVSSLSALAMLLVEKGDYKEAEEILKHALALAQKASGNDLDHVKDKQLQFDYANSLKTLGLVYEKTDRAPEAPREYLKASRFMPEPLLQNNATPLLLKVLASQRTQRARTFTTEEKNVNEMIDQWTPLQERAEHAVEQGDFESALPTLRKAYRIARTVNPVNDQSMDSLTVLLKVLNKTGSFSESERLIAENFSHMKANPPTKSIDNALGQMGNTYMCQHNYPQAERMINLRLHKRKILRGPENVHVAETLNDLGKLYMQMGNYPKAQESLNEALKILSVNDRLDDQLAHVVKDELAAIRAHK